jgi:hypothetical protein
MKRIEYTFPHRLLLLFILSLSMVTTAINQTQRLLSLIRYRYELETPKGASLSKKLANMDMHSWDILKYKFLSKAMGAVTRGQPQRFLLIFSNSSVTAGLDNYFNQGYPAVLNSRHGTCCRHVIEQNGGSI